LQGKFFPKQVDAKTIAANFPAFFERDDALSTLRPFLVGLKFGQAASLEEPASRGFSLRLNLLRFALIAAKVPLLSGNEASLSTGNMSQRCCPLASRNSCSG
jgi:hypothetical protein